MLKLFKLLRFAHQCCFANFPVDWETGPGREDNFPLEWETVLGHRRQTPNDAAGNSRIKRKTRCGIGTLSGGSPLTRSRHGPQGRPRCMKAGCPFDSPAKATQQQQQPTNTQPLLRSNSTHHHDNSCRPRRIWNRRRSGKYTRTLPSSPSPSPLLLLSPPGFRRTS